MSQQDSDNLGATPGYGRTVNAFKDLIIRDVMIQMRVMCPAHVVSYAAPVSAGEKSKPALVRVQPHFYTVVRMNSEAECTAELQAEGWVASQEFGGWYRKKPLPEIGNCPVAWVGPAGMLPRGPLKEGESGMLLFSDRSLDKWTQIGGPVDPVFQDFHILNNAVFVPGLRYGTNAQSIDGSKFVIGPETGTAGMEVTDAQAPALPDVRVYTEGETATVHAATTINLGDAAVLGVARETDSVDPRAAMTAWALVVETFINGLVPGTFTPANSFSGTVANNFGVISSSSAKVKAE